MKFSKNVNNKKHAPKLIYFNEKKIEKDSDNFWHRKLTLKVRNWHFLIAWFRADVDLTKTFLWKSAIFHSIQLPTIWCGSWWKFLKCYLLQRYQDKMIIHGNIVTSFAIFFLIDFYDVALAWLCSTEYRCMSGINY